VLLFYFDDFYLPFRSKDKTDMDVIRENHRFLWTDEDDPDENWYVFFVDDNKIQLFLEILSLFV
jgi:hypothetical protein